MFSWLYSGNGYEVLNGEKKLDIQNDLQIENIRKGRKGGDLDHLLFQGKEYSSRFLFNLNETLRLM